MEPFEIKNFDLGHPVLTFASTFCKDEKNWLPSLNVGKCRKDFAQGSLLISRYEYVILLQFSVNKDII